MNHRVHCICLDSGLWLGPWNECLQQQKEEHGYHKDLREVAPKPELSVCKELEFTDVLTNALSTSPTAVCGSVNLLLLLSPPHKSKLFHTQTLDVIICRLCGNFDMACSVLSSKA